MTEIKAVKALIRHGLEVRDTRYIPITSHSVDRLETIGESIPDETDRIDASVLVMGAYTHSRIQQFLLGGVTRDIVAKTRIPAVMTHKTSEISRISFCNNRKLLPSAEQWRRRERSLTTLHSRQRRTSALPTKDETMQNEDTLIAVFADHPAAEKAIRALVDAGLLTQNLSLVGKSSPSGEKTVLHGIGNQLKFWGTRGAFWGALWGLFFGGLFVAFPEIGIVVVLGYLAATTISAVESESIADGFGTLETALTGLGIPFASATRHEAAVKADGFLVMAHGPSEEIDRARTIVATAGATSIEIHGRLKKSRLAYR